MLKEAKTYTRKKREHQRKRENSQSISESQEEGRKRTKSKKIPEKKRKKISNKRLLEKQIERKPSVTNGRQAKKRPKGGRNPKKGKSTKKTKLSVLLLQLLAAVIVTVVGIWLISFFTFTVTKVNGYSMMPTFSDGETLFVQRLGKVKRFSLVYIKMPHKQGREIRRVIGLPGEQIRYEKDRLSVNHEWKEESFIIEEIQEADASESYYTQDFTMTQLFKEEKVPAGKYLVLGDNRPYSTDSRYYGFVDEREIIGIVTMRLFPLHRMERY